MSIYNFSARASWLIHDLVFDDTSETLCSRAWRLRDQSRFWRFWVWVFGARHCRSSYLWHWYGSDDSEPK